MMPARTIAVAGLLSLVLVLPNATRTAAQNTGPEDGGVQRNDQSGRIEATPPAVREAPPLREPKVEPPARTDDDFELPPAGCRYRGNKLDLIV